VEASSASPKSATGEEVRVKDLVDVDVFGGGAGFVIDKKLVAQGFVAIEIFPVKENVLGVHAVLDGVLRAAHFALFARLGFSLCRSMLFADGQLAFTRESGNGAAPIAHGVAVDTRFPPRQP